MSKASLTITPPPHIPHAPHAPHTPAPVTSSAQDLTSNDRPYGGRLFDHAWESQAHSADLPLLSFDTLQRTNIIHIQNELAKLKGAIFTKETIETSDLERMRTLLHHYTIAVQDYDYFRHLRPTDRTKAIARQADFNRNFPEILAIGDPYNTQFCEYSNASSSKPDALRNFLIRSLPLDLTWSQEERKEREEDFYDKKLPKRTSALVERLARFIIAVFGGLSLVVPMLIMSIHPSLTKALITASAATILFSAFLSFALETSDHDTLAATAAYAAVLVVFVGTSTTHS